MGTSENEREKNEGGLRRGAEGEPVRLRLSSGIAGAAIPSDWRLPHILSNPGLPSRNSILQELGSQVSGLKIDQSEGIAAPAIPEEGR